MVLHYCLAISTAAIVLFVPLFTTAPSHPSANSPFNWPSERYRSFDTFLEDKSRHVCALEEVRGNSRRKYYSECMNSVPVNVCGKPTFIRYHCCTGFDLEHPKADGCYLVKPVVNLDDTMKNLYLVEFNKYIEGAEATKILTQTNSTVTVFAPQNKAFKRLTPEAKRQFSERSTDNLLMLHMANLRLPTSQLQNNEKISTYYKNNQSLHVHRYASGIITVNCVRVMLPNQLATNGIVHVVEDVIKPIENNENLMEALSKRTDAKKFVAALKSTGINKKLEQNNHLTVVLPTDASIEKLGKRWDRIKNNPELLKKFVLYHIIDCCICSTSVLGPYYPRTLEGQKMRLNCDVNDQISFNDVLASQVDHVTTNGIIHTVDEAIYPDSILSVEEKLEQMGHHQHFLNLSSQAAISDQLAGNRPPPFITVFAPTDAAFAHATDEEVAQWMARKKEMRMLASNHVVVGDYSTSVLVGLEFVAAGLSDPKSSLDINLHDNVFYMNNAKIVKPDIRVWNGVIHVVDSLIFPNVEKIMAKLKDSPDVSIFFSLMKLADLKEAGVGKGQTVFAVSDSAFKTMGKDELEMLKTQMDKLTSFLKRHIVAPRIYPATLQPKLIHKFQTLANQTITIINKSTDKTKKEPKLNINGNVNVLKYHVNNVNGVLYVIDKIL